MLSWCLLVCDIRPSSQGSSASQGPALPLHASDRLPARGQPGASPASSCLGSSASQGPALPLHVPPPCGYFVPFCSAEGGNFDSCFLPVIVDIVDQQTYLPCCLYYRLREEDLSSLSRD